VKGIDYPSFRAGVAKEMTKIHKLEQHFPGLADQVRKWFDTGIPCIQVVQLLREQYGVSVPRWTVGYFRTKFWARERERMEARLIELAAIAEFNRLQEMKAASGANFQGFDK
jgi:hypothetical protein